MVPSVAVTAPAADLNVSAGSHFAIHWQADYPAGDASIALYLDADTNPAQGLIPIATGLSKDNAAGVYAWRVNEALVGGQYHVYATISDNGVAGGSYAAGRLTIEPSGSFRLRSPIEVTSPDYAYEYEYQGEICKGVTHLQMGDNVVTVSHALPNGATATFQFTVRLVASLIHAESVSYDALNRIVQRTNGNGIETRLTYDWMNRLVRRESDNGAIVGFAYDVLDRRVSMTDSAGTTFYEWDDLDRLTAVVRSQNDVKGDADDRTMRYEYDLAGRKTAVVYPDGERTQYGYDNADRPLTVSNVTRNLAFTYAYDEQSGLLRALKRPNGIETTYVYDGMGRLTNICHRRASGEAVANFGYILDAAGKATECRITETGSVTRVEQYLFDRFDRLVKVVYADDGAADLNDQTVLYTYDGNGNRLTATTLLNGAVSDSRRYWYGNENRLLRISDGIGATLVEYGYDASGNMVQETSSGRTRFLTYDERSLLIGVVDGTNNITYGYDGDGYRISSTINGETTIFVNDINRSLGETAQELNLEGVVTASFTLGAQRLADHGTDGDAYDLTDRLGSVRLKATAAGALRQTCDYDAFGCVRRATGAAGCYTFAGERQDPETGLIYLRARYYIPETGRFATKDPLGILAGPNGYVYCDADPINNIDPTGTFEVVPAARYCVVGPAVNVGKGVLSLAILMAPEPSSKLALGWAAFNLVRAAYGLGANGVNCREVLKGQPPVSSGNMLKDAAAVVLPGNQNVQNALEFAQAVENFSSPNKVMGAAGFLYQGMGYWPSAPSGGGASSPGSSPVRTPTAVPPGSGGSISGGSYVKRQPTPKAYTPPPIPDLIADLDKERTTFDVNKMNPYYIPPSSYNPNVGFDEAAAAADPRPGGILIDKAAQLIGSNLSDMRGAVYDPISGQFVILGTAGQAGVDSIDLDYLFTALEVVYGSAQPPWMSLDSPVSAATPWTDHGDGDGVFDPGEDGGFLLRYQPAWSEHDTTVDVTIQADLAGTTCRWTARFDCVAQDQRSSWGRAMKLVFHSWVIAPPMDVTLNLTPWRNNDWTGCDLTLCDSGENCDAQFTLRNNSQRSYLIHCVDVKPARQHVRLSDRLEGSRLGWVMFEADRTLKSLSVGRDNLSVNVVYHSANVAVPGYQNLLERWQASDRLTPSPARLWLIPSEFTIERSRDPDTGRSGVVFRKASVACNTEALIMNRTQSPEPKAFAEHFTTNYDAFAAMSFPCLDPDDPEGRRVFQVKIFEKLREAMKAVALAQFFRDNNVPVDMSWLQSWKPRGAHIPKTVPTAWNELSQNGRSISCHGGVDLSSSNAYIASASAESMTAAVQVSRPEEAGHPDGDIPAQVWTTDTDEGTLTAVAVQTSPEPQDGSIRLAETDLSFDGPGTMPLQFSRYYCASWMGDTKMGPGWQCTPFRLEFERPVWFDSYGWLRNGSNGIWHDADGNTRLRSGAIRVLNLQTGETLDFTSSLTCGGSAGLNNPRVAVHGLADNALPTFTPGLRRNGATLIQTWPDGNYVCRSPSGAQLTFDHQGRLLRIEDRHAHAQTFAYGSAGLLTNILDSAGRQLTLLYDSETNRLLSVAGPAGERMTYSYATNGCLVSARHVRSGAEVFYAYDNNRLLTGKTWSNGRSTVAAIADLKGRATAVSDARSNTVFRKFTQNTDGTIRVTETSDPQVTNATYTTARNEFDRMGRLLKSRSATGAETLFGYDAGSLQPNLVQLPSSNRPAIQIERNNFEQPTRVRDPGNVGAQDVTVSYDATNGQVRCISDPAGRTVDLRYHRTGDLALLCCRPLSDRTPFPN